MHETGRGRDFLLDSRPLGINKAQVCDKENNLAPKKLTFPKKQTALQTQISFLRTVKFYCEPILF